MKTFIKRDLPTNQYNAAMGANNPSASNVFATIADLPTVTGDANRLVFDVKINQAGGITKGQAVYVNGADGTNITVGKADYSTEATSSKTIGLLITTGNNNNQRQVIAEGILKGTGSEPLNTSAGAAGDPVWLGDDGNLIYGLVNKPYAPNHLVFIGIVVESNPTVGEIFVKIQNGFELDELHDVQLKGAGNVPLDGEVLTYEAATQLWKAKPVVSQNDSPLVFVIAATEAALVGSPVYYNGPANDGIGATLTATINGVVSDGTAVDRIDTNYIPEAGDLILVKNQVNQFHNGIYEITNTGSASTPYILTRSVDVDAPEELYPLQVNAFQGLVNGSKYFTQTNTAWGSATPPVIGFANIIFALTTLTTSPLQITFVDNVTNGVLPAYTYTPGPDSAKPGVGATLTATGVGTLVVSGMTAGASTTSLTQFTTLLVRNEIETLPTRSIRYNGTYQVINPGSATSRWVLRRIDDLAAGFNKALRIVFCSHNVSAFSGTYFIPTWNPTLLNKNIGITSGVPLNINRIDYVAYAPQNGRFGIANSNGAYSYHGTLQSAINAAVVGQTVEVFADYTELTDLSVILKNGVNINGNGHTYTLSGNGTASCLIDNGVTANCKINNFNLVRTSSTTYNTLNKAALNLTGASIIDCSGSTFTGSSAVSVIVNGPIKLSNIVVYGSLSSQLVISSSGAIVSNVYAHNTTLNGSSFTGCISNTGILQNATAYHTGGNPAITNGTTGKALGCRAYSTSAVGFDNQGIAQDCHGFSTFTAGFTCFVASISENCTGTSSASAGISINGQNGARLLNCVGYSTAGQGITATNGFMMGCHGYSTANNGIGASNGNNGTGSAYNCTAISDTSSAFALSTQNAYTISNCTIIARAANSAASGIEIGFYTVPYLIVGNTIQVTSNTANCIRSNAAASIRYSQNRFTGALVSVGTNITQAIVNTEDAYGNITL